MVQVGVECGIELIDRLTTPVGAREFTAGVLGSRGVQKRPRRLLKHVSSSQQCLGITLEYAAGVLSYSREQRDRRPLPFEHFGSLQDTCAQAGVTGGRCHPRTQDHLTKTLGPSFFRRIPVNVATVRVAH